MEHKKIDHPETEIMLNKRHIEAELMKSDVYYLPWQERTPTPLAQTDLTALVRAEVARTEASNGHGRVRISVQGQQKVAEVAYITLTQYLEQLRTRTEGTASPEFAEIELQELVELGIIQLTSSSTITRGPNYDQAQVVATQNISTMHPAFKPATESQLNRPGQEINFYNPIKRRKND